MPVDPEEIRRRFEEEMRAWADGPVLGDQDAPSCVPAVNARVVGDLIVFDVAVPKGVG